MASNKVEALRKARGWTRMELAEKVGMSHSAVTKIERGERRIPDDRAREFARVFGVSAGEVIAFVVSKEQAQNAFYRFASHSGYFMRISDMADATASRRHRAAMDLSEKVASTALA